MTDDEFLSFYKTLYGDTQFDKSLNLLVDLRQTESSERSAAALNEFAYFMQRQFVDTNTTPKVAVVAPKDVSFGLARMFEVLSDDVPLRFMVFRTADTALSWLGLSDNLMNNLAQDPQLIDSPDFE